MLLMVGLAGGCPVAGGAEKISKAGSIIFVGG